MTLYHYTSIETLYAVIKGIEAENDESIRFTLWATHAGFLNDLTEGQLLANTLKRLGAPVGLLNNLIGMLGYPFVVSLSELDDDLNMWRCYANQGKGVAIGLDKEVIEDAIKHQVWCNVADFGKCDYYSEEELVEYLKRNGVEAKLKDDNLLPLSKLLSKALLFKNKSFIAEEEWRIYANYLESGFRVADNLIVPYYKVFLPIEAMTFITFGPKCDYVKNSFSVYRMLASIIGEECANGIELNKSTVPLV